MRIGISNSIDVIFPLVCQDMSTLAILILDVEKGPF